MPSGGTVRPAIARHEVLGRIASGGMGDVWLARALGPAGFAKVVVLKTIRGGDASEALTPMFLREARVAALLSHPNCVQVFELGEYDGGYFIAMEYIDGFSLARILRQAKELDRPMPVEVVARILMDAAAGLDYAHELKDPGGTKLGLIHRDVSLDNLLVTFAGLTKVVDFGIARATTQIAGERTESGTLKGKYSYMAPEYLRNEPIDGRLDVFALGVVAFRALTGRKPFHGDSEAQTVTAILAATEAPSCRAIRPELPVDLDRAIQRALAPDPARRFGTARELRAAIGASVPGVVDSDGVAAYLATLWSEAAVDRVAIRKLLAGEVEDATQPVLVPTPPSTTNHDRARTDVEPAPPTVAGRSSPRLASVAETAVVTPAKRNATEVDAAEPATRRSAQTLPTPSGTTPPSATLQTRPRGAGWLLVAGALLVASAVVVVVIAQREGAPAEGPVPGAPPVQATPAAPATQRIAVMPFSAGEGAEPGITELGVYDSITGNLARTRSLVVIAGKVVSAAMAAKNGVLPKVAAELGATKLVTGSTRTRGDKVEVDIAIIDAASGAKAWSRTYTGMTADLFALQDRIYPDLIGALGVVVTDSERGAALVHPTEDLDAYQHYLKGRRMYQAASTAAPLEAALASYEAALAKDPRFALAYAGIADVSVQLLRITKEPRWAQRAVSAAEQAVKLDPNLAEAHTALGGAYKTTGRTAEAIAELRTATSLAPSSDDAFRRLGGALAQTGQLDEALAAFKRAVAINPYFWRNHVALARVHHELGQYAEAVAAAEEAARIAPDASEAWIDVGTQNLSVERLEVARAAYEKSIALEPNAASYTNLGYVHALLGKYPEALAAYEHAAQLSPTEPTIMANWADGLRLTGKPDRARHIYRKAIQAALAALELNPRDFLTRGGLAVMYAKIGDAVSARKMIASALAISKSVDLLSFAVGVETFVGTPDSAIAALETALAGGASAFITEREPDFLQLHDDPRFAPTIAKYRKKPK